MRVICLTMRLAHLAEIRALRVKEQLGYGEGYADERTIQNELEVARELSDRRGWRVLDVTGQAVEETATKIMALLVSA